MARGHEEAEWWRLAHLIAFLANRLRFSDGPTVQPKDVNPLYEKLKLLVPRDAKDDMNRFFAKHPEIPMVRMRQKEDGSWETVKEDG